MQEGGRAPVDRVANSQLLYKNHPTQATDDNGINDDGDDTNDDDDDDDGNDDGDGEDDDLSCVPTL